MLTDDTNASDKDGETGFSNQFQIGGTFRF